MNGHGFRATTTPYPSSSNRPTHEEHPGRRSATLQRAATLLLAIGALALVARAEVTTYALPSGSNTAGGISVDAEGNVYSADFGGTQLFKIDLNGNVSIFATGLDTPSGNAFDADGNLYQSNYGANTASDSITRIAPDGTTETFVDGLTGPVGIAIDRKGTFYVAMCDQNNLTRVAPDGSTSVFAQSSLFLCPNGITFDEEGTLYVVNFNNGALLKIDDQGNVETFATIPGGGNGHVTYVAGHLYVSSRSGHQIHRVDIESAQIDLLAGSGTAGRVDGENLVAQFNQPNAMARDRAGSVLYTNGFGNAVRRIELDLKRPAKPKNVKAKKRKRGKAKLSWKHDSFNREGFIIELASSTTGFEEIGRVSATAKKATIRDLVAGEEYVVRIRAFNGVRTSKPSKKVRFTAKQ